MPTLRQEEGKINSVSLYLLQISIDDTLFGNLQGWPPPIFFVLSIHILSGVPPVKWRVEVNSTSLSEGNNKISLWQYLVSRKLVVWIKILASYIAWKKKINNPLAYQSKYLGQTQLNSYPYPLFILAKPKLMIWPVNFRQIINPTQEVDSIACTI